ncbi:dihydrodipicolinate synthase family protein [Nesterenkonia populi]
MFNSKDSRGVWPAAVLPFDDELNIDVASLRSHVAGLADVPGVKAVVVNGHAGEVTSLTHEEQELVVRVTVEAVQGKVLVISGVFGSSTAECVSLAKMAKRAGADGTLLFPPPLFSGGAQVRDEMPKHFVTEVAKAAEVPMVLFELPVRDGLGYKTSVLQELCRTIDSIQAVKEGSDDPVLYERNVNAIREYREDVQILTTNNAWLLESLAIGADGILSGAGCIAAELQVDLFTAMEEGDLAEARAANSKLYPLTEAFYRSPLLDMHNRMKVGLEYLGRLPSANVRPPLLPLREEERVEIHQAVRTAGLAAA